MSRLLRHFAEGNTYFVTAVTHRRAPILATSHELLLDSMNKFRTRLGYTLVAWVIMPDHMHLIIDPKALNLSRIIQRVKVSFSKRLLSRTNDTSRPIWQSRFWDHVIRDGEDMRRHVDYIHYNPVKHGIVARPSDWRLSSFRDFLARGYYSDDWGSVEPPSTDGLFGE